LVELTAGLVNTVESLTLATDHSPLHSRDVAETDFIEANEDREIEYTDEEIDRAFAYQVDLVVHEMEYQ
jgi:hypothetical protein